MADPSWQPTAAEVADASHLTATDDGVDSAIGVATRVTQRIEAADSDLEDGALKDIAKYLAAHIATVPNPQMEKEKGASFSATFLRESSYGETAAMLDPTGILADDDTAETGIWTPDAKGIR